MTREAHGSCPRGSVSRRRMLAAGVQIGVAALPAFLSDARSWGAEGLLTRPIPHTGETLPAVGLGTAAVFDVGQDDTKRTNLKGVIAALVSGGGRIIDTASSYGTAEDVIGALVLELQARGSIFLATKVEATQAAPGLKEFRHSLERLKTNKVDLLQLHNVGDPKQSLAAFRDWKAQGLCRYVGVTTTFSGDYGAMEAVVRRERPDFMQVDYSIGDREVEKRLLPVARDAGSAVLTALPFGRASLFRVVKGKELPDWAKDFDAANWGQFFLKYLLGNEIVTAVIPGTDKAEHMSDNLAAGRGRLPDQMQRSRMVEYFDSLR
jgi:aryl-alcohol dehydrogenase-like predicted oxidoreductase